eukprot:CAMPEP_0201727984 /NCGR_PEP_ID=MMETSP0593-20130828/14366_1 /ASSEMBLY_ACC=CAM_ASM_000672 /TAXON_ID=267983 /ORGANISM="Skeletonema japonicum, Strain CCMP2506" /LENGTH=403 /DNA_ID=CAMNT_0048219953 /DNA_START=106 /DNA_END=1317 /DNA_ORIENTATION=-
MRSRSLLIASILGLGSCLSADAFMCTSSSSRANLHHNDASSSLCKATSLPDLNYGLSDEEFHTWLQNQLQNAPGRNTYASTYQDSLTAIVNWRKRYRGNPSLWKRIFKKDRVIKELIESAPVIDFVKRAIDNQDDTDDDTRKKFTIIDLCSGKGYLSMFLSEILPKEKVDKFILVDKAWAIASKKTTTTLKPHHMNWDHIYGTTVDTDGEESSYFTTWPIPLFTSKQDLKDSCNQRQMTKHFFNKIDGPVIILAVHLCGTLSLKAIEMFNNNQVKLFALKPCCLPQMVYANRGDVFRIGQHEFDAKDVCSPGQFSKGNWNGPPRWHLQPRFDCWADNLFKGIDIGGSKLQQDDSEEDNGYRVSMSHHDGIKVKDDIVIQVDGGFQNTYIFAERDPVTLAIWER